MSSDPVKPAHHLVLGGFTVYTYYPRNRNKRRCDTPSASTGKEYRTQIADATPHALIKRTIKKSIFLRLVIVTLYTATAIVHGFVDGQF